MVLCVYVRVLVSDLTFISAVSIMSCGERGSLHGQDPDTVSYMAGSTGPLFCGPRSTVRVRHKRLRVSQAYHAYSNTLDIRGR